MGAALSKGGKGAPIVAINVTPMVDIMLVLLVIMMVTANFIVSQSMNVDLPKAAAGDRATPSVAIVSVGKNGQLGFDDDIVTEAELIERLKSVKADNPDINLILNGDREAKHGDVVHALDLAKLQGISHFAVSVEQP
jgi:biopolymer transport protein ExbD